MLRFASLASGSGGNCLIAEAGQSRVLIDCGLKLTETERRLERLGVAPAGITAILVTHEHADHACGVFEFAAAHRVAVYLSFGTLGAMRQEGKVLDGVRTVQVDGRQSFAVGDVQVHTFTVPHDAR